MSENPRRGRQARNFITKVPKILDLKSSSEQIFLRKLSLGALEILQEPDVRKDQLKWRDLKYLGTFLRLILICILDGDGFKLTFFDG